MYVNKTETNTHQAVRLDKLQSFILTCYLSHR